MIAHKVIHPAARTTTAVSASELVVGDVVHVPAGETIPADGEVIEGVASVDESAITGESAPVVRESGGDRSAVTGGRESSPTGSSSVLQRCPDRAFLIA